MPTSEIIIKVFVSSPNDVTDERNLLEDIVRELNNTWSKFLRLRLDLIKWETHCFPGVGNYSQEVINKEIDDDYDIFIGIMWQRFGTPTALYGSGTIEEFERAYQRYKENPDGIKIMFYFKDTPPDSISEIDPEQIFTCLHILGEGIGFPFCARHIGLSNDLFVQHDHHVGPYPPGWGAPGLNRKQHPAPKQRYLGMTPRLIPIQVPTSLASPL